MKLDIFVRSVLCTFLLKNKTHYPQSRTCSLRLHNSPPVRIPLAAYRLIYVRFPETSNTHSP